MAFYGAVESFDRRRISGWVRFEDRNGVTPVSVTLAMRDRLPIEPTRTTPRDTSTEFVFTLPAAYHDKPWAEFVDDYDGVRATAVIDGVPREWRVPMYKTVLLNRDPGPPPAPVAAAPTLVPGNRTTLAARRLRDYAAGPVPGKRLAAFTIAHGEALMLPLWAHHYAAAVGAENLFVLDHGGAVDAATLPAGVKVVGIPRDGVDLWQIVRTAGMFQRFLLESYESVLYADCDEFVCAAPDMAAGRDLRQVLLELAAPIGIATGYNLWHDMDAEPAYDPARPVLAQRRLIARETGLDKPLIARVPMSWEPGFVAAAEGGVRVAGLYLLQLRTFDLDYALGRAAAARAVPWHPPDLTHRIASRERMPDGDIVRLFRMMNTSFRQTSITVFDPDARRTIVPDWMAHAIAV